MFKHLLGRCSMPGTRPPKKKPAMFTKRDTIVRNVVILACAVDAADKALLPASFKALSEQMNVGPAQLGALSFAESIAFSLALPIWGSMMHFFSSRELLTAGCCLWGSATLLLAGTTTYELHIILRFVVGAGLAAVNPIGQAIICDITPEAEQGWAFGLLQSMSNGLSMLVSFGTTTIATSTILGFRGWRVAYVGVASVSLLVGAAVWGTVPHKVSVPSTVGQSWCLEQRRVLAAVAKKPSFLIMVAQGVTGGIPWNAFAFLTFFFQLSGYKDWQTGQIMLFGGAGGVVGGLLGGALGDFFSSISPFAGRCAVAQASVLLGTVCFLWFIHIPYGDYSFLLVSGFFFAFQAVATWTPAAALRPICGAIFQDSKDRAQVLALWIAFEGVMSAICGAPLAGLLSEMFGFKLTPGHQESQLEESTRSLEALRTALVGVSVLPWTLCFLAWIPMYWTYPRDHAFGLAARGKHDFERAPQSLGKE